MRIHDGAYGTLLQRHLHGDETADDLCVRAPHHVVEAHRAYLDAGATVIQTNAFLAHVRGSERRRRELQLAALDCAREAAAGAAADVLVLATIGPAGSSARDFWRDLELMLEHDAVGILCETVTERSIADAVLAAWHEVARGVRDVQLLVGCSISPSRGTDSWRWVTELAAEAPDGIRLGLNCCEGPIGLRAVLAELAQLRGSAWTMPSAGLPTSDPSGVPEWPLAAPGDWAEAVAELVDGLSVDGVGGCCGTTPDSIASLAST